MKRFFFDYRGTDQTLLDYSGQEFQTIQSAADFAEAIAFHLMHSLSQNWSGWSVEVRNAAGERCLSLRVLPEGPGTAYPN